MRKINKFKIIRHGINKIKLQMLLNEKNQKYKLMVENLHAKCQELQTENERCVLRINTVKKLTRRRVRDVELLKRRLDRHKDNWRSVPMVAPHPKRKIEQKRGPKPKVKAPNEENETKEKKIRKRRTKKNTTEMNGDVRPMQTPDGTQQNNSTEQQVQQHVTKQQVKQNVTQQQVQQHVAQPQVQQQVTQQQVQLVTQQRVQQIVTQQRVQQITQQQVQLVSPQQFAQQQGQHVTQQRLTQQHSQIRFTQQQNQQHITPQQAQQLLLQQQRLQFKPI